MLPRNVGPLIGRAGVSGGFNDPQDPSGGRAELLPSSFATFLSQKYYERRETFLGRGRLWRAIVVPSHSIDTEVMRIGPSKLWVAREDIP